MEQISNEIPVAHTDREINALIGRIGEEERPCTRHFNQGEDFFLELESEYEVPSFDIHHDVRRSQPSPQYAASLRTALETIIARAPQVFRELAYFFDPSDILRPCFFRLYRIDGSSYLYLLRADLTLRPGEGRIVERGTNDATPGYASKRLFLEALVIPLDEVVRTEDRIRGFRIRQTISQTWIGEFGRGYFQQGIWMDADLTRFFSRLFLPPQRRTYPYFPFQCKYKTVCHSLIGLTAEKRSAAVPQLHRILSFLVPEMEMIQNEMRHAVFSEQLPVYQELRRRVPDSWFEALKGVRVDAYLNAADQKEFTVED